MADMRTACTKRKERWRFLSRSLCIALLFWAPGASVHARDLGVHGPLFGISEPSLFDMIAQRLNQMEASGELERMQNNMQARTRHYVQRPRPVTGLGKTAEYASWDVDLSITVNEDLSDHRGVVFAPAGTVINPLDYSTFNKRILLVDGDDTAQVEFALAGGDETDTLIVIVNGDPLQLMRRHGRRFWFDQDAVLVDRFGIRNVPAVISRADPVMHVEEVVIP